MLQRVESIRPSPSGLRPDSSLKGLLDVKVEKTKPKLNGRNQYVPSAQNQPEEVQLPEPEGIEFSISSLEINGEQEEIPRPQPRTKPLSPQQSNRSDAPGHGKPSRKADQKRRSVQLPGAQELLRCLSGKLRKEFAEVDELIRENIRRNKMQADMQKLLQAEAEEKHRMARESLAEQNKRIRVMNARKVRNGRNRSQEDVPESRCPWGADQRRIRSGTSNSLARGFSSGGFMASTQQCPLKPKVDPVHPVDRVSRLGLDIIYMKNSAKSSKRGSTGENAKEQRKRADKEQQQQRKENLRNYIQQKNGERAKLQRNKEDEARSKKERIDENKIKLSEFVRSIFRSKKRKEEPQAKRKMRKGRKRDSAAKARGNCDDVRYNDYCKILAGVEKEEERVRDIVGPKKKSGKANNALMMLKIKEQLMKEIAMSGDEPEDLQSAPPEISVATRMQKSLSQPGLGLVEKVGALSQRYESIKKREVVTPQPEEEEPEQSKIDAIAGCATAIQACFRGYLARKRLYQQLEEEAQKERKEIENEEKKPQENNNNFEGQLQGLESRSENEKVIHLSRINNIEDEPRESDLDTNPKLTQEQPPHDEDIKAAVIPAVSQKETREIGIATEPAEPPPAVQPTKPAEEPRVLPVTTSTVAVNTDAEEAPPKPAASVIPVVAVPERKIVLTINPIETISLAPAHIVAKAVPEELKQAVEEGVANKKKLEIDTASLEVRIDLPPPAKMVSLEDAGPGSTRSLGRFGSGTRMQGGSIDSEKSEGAPNDSLDLIIEKELSASTRSIFDRNTFQLFAIKKYGDNLNTDNLSRLLSMREKVIMYRERTEKKYINKMYKCNQYSPRTYQSKRKELEKWVSREKDDIKKTKTRMLDSWKKTAEMIEEAHTNALQIKKFFFKHAMSYNSDTNSTVSLPFDASRPPTAEPDLDEVRVIDQHEPRRSQCSDPGRISALTQPEDLGLGSGEEIKESVSPPQNRDILIQDNTGDAESVSVSGPISSPATAKHVSPVAGVFPKEVDLQTPLDGKQSPAQASGQERGTGPAFSVAPVSSTSIKSMRSTDEEAPDHGEDVDIEWQSELAQQKQCKVEAKSELEPEQKQRPTMMTPEKESPEPTAKPIPSLPAEVPKPQSQPQPATTIPPEKKSVSAPAPEKPAETKVATPQKPPVILQLPPPQFSPQKPPSKSDIADAIVTSLYSQLMGEVAQNLFPVRGAPAQPQSPAVQAQNFLKMLATTRKKGIQTDLYHINDYLDELFGEVLFGQKEPFMGAVNQPILKPSLDVLAKLQSADQDQRMQLMQQTMQQAPHDICPVLALDTYLELEKKKEISKQEASEEDEKERSQSQQLVDECEHIHNKAIFDAVNEALNLIRPYGLSGLPMPWSMLPRILFTRISEPSIIIRNVKNMVHCGVTQAYRYWIGRVSRWARFPRWTSSWPTSLTRNISRRSGRRS